MGTPGTSYTGPTGPMGPGNSYWTLNSSNQITLTNTSESLYIPSNIIAGTLNSLTISRGGGNISTNTAVGTSTLTYNTTGYDNAAFGQGALYNNTTGQTNTSLGTQSMSNNVVGSANTAVGFNALNSNNSNYNTAIGYAALSSNINGQDNVALGINAGSSDVGGNSNTYLGSNTFTSGTFTNSTAIGYGAEITASNQLTLGTAGQTVYIPGTVTATSYNATSDYRIKSNVTALDDTYIVDSLNPVTYLNTKTEKQDMGLIAHELQEVYPFLVNGTKDNDTYQTINYMGLIALLIKETKELKQNVKELKERIKILEEDV